jgi:hypothetical protein
MYSKTNDRVTTAAGLIAAGAMGAQIDIDKVINGDRGEQFKALAVIATAIWSWFTNRKPKQTGSKEV